MNFTYENQGTTSFLSYTLGVQEVIDTMGLGMIQNNKISGVLPIAFTQIDKERYLRYNISSTVTLSNFLSGIVTRQRLLAVFESICDCFLASEEYLLEKAFFILEKEYMFCDVSTGKTSLVYLPVLRDANAVNLPMFFKELIFGVQSDLNEDGSHVARIINYLNSNDNFSLKEFRQLIIQLKMGMQEKAIGQVKPAPTIVQVQPVPAQSAPVNPVVAQPVMQKAPVIQPAPAVPVQVSVQEQSKQQSVQPQPPKEKTGLFGRGGKKKEKKEKVVATPNQPAPAFAVPGAPQSIPPIKVPAAPIQTPVTPVPAPAAPMQTPVTPVPNPVMPASVPTISAPVIPQNFAQGTTVLTPEMLNPGTTVLTPDMMPGGTPVIPKVLQLTRLSTKESMQITKNIFRIGKERSYVDYFIGDNSAISRSHADIITKDGNYFIRDNNSLNHTYLDDELLQSNQEYPVKPGSKIVLADEEFSLTLV